MVLIDRPNANTKFVRTEARREAAAPARRQRYRPGKLPDFMPDEDGDDDGDDEGLTLLAQRSQTRVRVVQREDRRLRRLEEAAEEPPVGGRRRKPRREAEILDNDDDDDAALVEDDAPRHRKIQRAEEAELLAPGGESEESEYEEVTESEGEEQHQVMAKPTFVAKEYRRTHLEKRQMEVERDEIESRQLDIRAKRREDTRQMVVDDVKRRDEDANNEAESEGELPDDNDYTDDEELEHARWVLREQQRMKRTKEERQKEEREKQEIERRRLLSDDARKQEDIDYQKKLVEMGLDKKKVQWNFMQKYYHKGAYFQHTEEKGMEAESLYRRDVGHAVGADRANKELLPKAMRVRGDKFGKRGQSKWTHLVDQDTSYQKDVNGEMMENPFVTTTFASGREGMSASQAHMSSENAMMFRHEKMGSVTPSAIGSAAYMTGGGHKDKQFERPAKRAK